MRIAWPLKPKARLVERWSPYFAWYPRYTHDGYFVFWEAINRRWVETGSWGSDGGYWLYSWAKCPYQEQADR